MIKKKKIISIILARAGSKGLKNKNLAKLDGKPLIYYPIEAALKSKYIEEVFVSTDSKLIKKIAEKYGAKVPFLRKKKYSQDSTTTEETLVNFVQNLKKKNIKPDIIVYFQTTDIFRNLRLVDQCIENLINNSKIESSFIITSDHKNYWINSGRQEFKRTGNKKNIYLPRQEKKPIYREDTGLCLATRAHTITKTSRIGRRIKVVINKTEIDMVDIHSKFDLWLANQIIKYKKIKPNFYL